MNLNTEQNQRGTDAADKIAHDYKSNWIRHAGHAEVQVGSYGLTQVWWLYKDTHTPSPSGGKVRGGTDRASEEGVVPQEVSEPNFPQRTSSRRPNSPTPARTPRDPPPKVSPVIPDFTCLGCDASHN